MQCATKGLAGGWRLPEHPVGCTFVTRCCFHFPESAGVRVILSDRHLLLRAVPPPAASCLEIGSTSPGALLYDARRLFDAQDARATGGRAGGRGACLPGAAFGGLAAGRCTRGQPAGAPAPWTAGCLPRLLPCWPGPLFLKLLLLLRPLREMDRRCLRVHARPCTPQAPAPLATAAAAALAAGRHQAPNPCPCMLPQPVPPDAARTA